MTRGTTGGRCWLAVVVAAGLAGLLPQAAAGPRPQGVAMVLASTGSVTVTGADGVTRKAQPMAVLEAGEVVATGAGSSLTMVLFADSREYAVGESARVELAADGPKALAGSLTAAATADRLKLPSNSSLSSRRLMGEMVRAAQVETGRFLQPANFGQVVDGIVRFEWRLGTTGTRHTLVVVDDDDEEVLRAEVVGSSFSFPPTGKEPLAPGGSYFATVWDPAAPQGNRAARAEAEFRVLTTAEAEQLRANEKAAMEESAADPDDPAPLMKLMLVQLEARLWPDAEATGRKLEALIPDNPNLQLYLARALASMGRVDEAAAASQRSWELQGR